MPLDLGQIPTESLLHELSRRYENIVVSACKDQPGDEATSLTFFNGNPILGLGLCHVLMAFLMEDLKDTSRGVDDIP